MLPRISLTQVRPVIHPAHNNDALPKVAWNITDFPDDHAEEKAQELIRERKQKKWTDSRHIVWSEGGDDVGKDQGGERDVHEDQ